MSVVSIRLDASLYIDRSPPGINRELRQRRYCATSSPAGLTNSGAAPIGMGYEGMMV
jgi:hypothetical protein